MRSVGQFQAGNFKSSGKSRVMWFPSVAAARAEPKLFELADAIEIDGQSLFYADRLSAVVDDGTPNTDAIKLTAVQFGRFVRAQPYLPSGVYFSAAEDGSDDWVRLNALVASEYGPGGKMRKIILLNGAYRMVQHAQWPRVGVHIEAQGPGVSIVCDVPSPDTDLNYRGPFCYDNGVVSPQPVATLSAQYDRGIDTISVASTIAPQAGQVLGLIAVNGATLTEYFGVIAVTGAGPYSLKLSRALKYSHTVANTTLAFFNAVRDIQLTGNGAHISGGADRFFSFPMSRDVKIKGWVLDGAGCVEYMCSIDGGSERGHISEMVLHNVISIGCCLEYGFGNKISDCYADGGGALFGSWGDSDVLENLVGVGNNALGAAGLLLGPGVYPAKGNSENISVRNVTLTNCSSGLAIANVKGLIVDGAKVTGGRQSIFASGVAAYPLTATFRRLIAEGSSDGAYVSQNYGDLVFEDCELSVSTGGSGYVGRSLAASCTATHTRGTVKLGTTGQIGISAAGGVLIIDGTVMDSTAGPNNSQPIAVSGGSLWATGVMFKATLATTIYCIVGGAGATMRIDNCRILSGTPNTGVRVDAATTYAWIGDNNDFGAATNFISGAGQVNFGTTALNGATPVSLPFAPTKAGSRVRLDRKTVGGTPSAALTWGVAAGVGGTMVSAAGDTSTVAWKIYES